MPGDSMISLRHEVVDTHAHLSMSDFDNDRTEIIARAKNAGVATIISVGIDVPADEQEIRLAERFPEVFAAVGVHPHEAASVNKAVIARLAELARHPRVVAIGETGLDFYRNRSSREVQLPALQSQLRLAANLDLPVIIHCRQADKEMLPLLREWSEHYAPPAGQPRGVIHCFNGDGESARQYVDMGFFIALGAYIGYPGSRMARVVAGLPLDRIVLETDCPFLPPQGYRGKRNEPAYLTFTLTSLAEARGVSASAIAAETTHNARKLFRLPLRPFPARPAPSAGASGCP